MAETKRNPAKNKRNPTHKLWIWMQDHGVSDPKMAELLGCSKRTVFRWLTEGLDPDLNLAQKCYDITDGYMGFMDWPTDYVREKKEALKKAMATRRNTRARARAGAAKKPAKRRPARQTAKDKT